MKKFIYLSLLFLGLTVIQEQKAVLNKPLLEQELKENPPKERLQELQNQINKSAPRVRRALQPVLNDHIAKRKASGEVITVKKEIGAGLSEADRQAFEREREADRQRAERAEEETRILRQALNQLQRMRQGNVLPQNQGDADAVPPPPPPPFAGGPGVPPPPPPPLPLAGGSTNPPPQPAQSARPAFLAGIEAAGGSVATVRKMKKAIVEEPKPVYDITNLNEKLDRVMWENDHTLTKKISRKLETIELNEEITSKRKDLKEFAQKINILLTFDTNTLKKLLTSTFHPITPTSRDIERNFKVEAQIITLLVHTIQNKYRAYSDLLKEKQEETAVLGKITALKDSLSKKLKLIKEEFKDEIRRFEQNMLQHLQDPTNNPIDHAPINRLIDNGVDAKPDSLGDPLKVALGFDDQIAPVENNPFATYTKIKELEDEMAAVNGLFKEDEIKAAFGELAGSLTQLQTFMSQIIKEEVVPELSNFAYNSDTYNEQEINDITRIFTNLSEEGATSINDTYGTLKTREDMAKSIKESQEKDTKIRDLKRVTDYIIKRIKDLIELNKILISHYDEKGKSDTEQADLSELHGLMLKKINESNLVSFGTKSLREHEKYKKFIEMMGNRKADIIEIDRPEDTIYTRMDDCREFNAPKRKVTNGYAALFEDIAKQKSRSDVVETTRLSFGIKATKEAAMHALLEDTIKLVENPNGTYSIFVLAPKVANYETDLKISSTLSTESGYGLSKDKIYAYFDASPLYEADLSKLQYGTKLEYYMIRLGMPNHQEGRKAEISPAEMAEIENRIQQWIQQENQAADANAASGNPDPDLPTTHKTPAEIEQQKNDAITAKKAEKLRTIKQAMKQKQEDAVTAGKSDPVIKEEEGLPIPGTQEKGPSRNIYQYQLYKLTGIEIAKDDIDKKIGGAEVLQQSNALNIIKYVLTGGSLRQPAAVALAAGGGGAIRGNPFAHVQLQAATGNHPAQGQQPQAPGDPFGVNLQPVQAHNPAPGVQPTGNGLHNIQLNPVGGPGLAGAAQVNQAQAQLQAAALALQAAPGGGITPESEAARKPIQEEKRKIIETFTNYSIKKTLDKLFAEERKDIKNAARGDNIENKAEIEQLSGTLEQAIKRQKEKIEAVNNSIDTYAQTYPGGRLEAKLSFEEMLSVIPIAIDKLTGYQYNEIFLTVQKEGHKETNINAEITKIEQNITDLKAEEQNLKGTYAGLNRFEQSSAIARMHAINNYIPLLQAQIEELKDIRNKITTGDFGAIGAHQPGGHLAPHHAAPPAHGPGPIDQAAFEAAVQVEAARFAQELADQREALVNRFATERNRIEEDQQAMVAAHIQQLTNAAETEQELRDEKRVLEEQARDNLIRAEAAEKQITAAQTAEAEALAELTDLREQMRREREQMRRELQKARDENTALRAQLAGGAPQIVAAHAIPPQAVAHQRTAAQTENLKSLRKVLNRRLSKINRPERSQEEERKAREIIATAENAMTAHNIHVMDHPEIKALVGQIEAALNE